MAKSKEYEMAIKIAGQIEKSFYNSTRLTKKELQSIARTAAMNSATISQTLTKGLDDAAPAFRGMEKIGATAFKAITTAAKITAAAVAAVVIASTVVGASFEEQMSTVKAISGASAAEFQDLNDLAKELGATTKFTATQVGQAMEYMAMAGWKTKDMLAGMQGVLNLAAASGEDLATTSDIVTDAMTAFGMGADQVEHFADVLAATATNSNTTVSMMGDSFSYVASLAGALGYSIEDTSIALGLMANSGIKASQAGTALRKIFAETTNGAKVSAKAFGEMTIATTNSDGSMRELKDIITDLRWAFSQMSESEKAVNAETIAGKTGMSGLLAIVNAGEADYKQLTEAIYNCSGAAEKMAETRMDNLSGDATIAKSALEGLGIKIYENLNEPLRDGVKWITEIIGKISTKLSTSGFLTDLSKKLPTAIRETKEFAGAMADFVRPFLQVGGWLVEHPGLIVGVITGIGTAIAVHKVASGIMSIVTALGALGPVGWTILGIAGVAAVIAGIVTSVKKGAAEAKKANLEDHFGKISLSLKDLDEAASGIIGSKNLDTLRESMEAFNKLDEVQQSIREVTSEIKKTNWKVSIGLELTQQDQEEYKNNLTKYISECQKYVEQQQYAVNLAVGILTKDDLKGHDIVSQVNDFYAGKQQQLSELGSELNKAITDAFQDGLLDMDEAQRIQDIQAQMARIQATLAGSNFDAELKTLQVKFGGELDPDSFKNLQDKLAEKVEAAKADYEQALTKATASASAMLADGTIDQSTYDSMTKEYQKNYYENIGNVEMKANSFQLDIIKQQYGTELSKALPDFEGKTQKFLDDVFANSGNGYNWDNVVGMFEYMKQEIESSGGLDKDTKAAIQELLRNMEPSQEQMQKLADQYRDAGEEIPQSIMDGINNYDMLKMLAGDGDYDTFWRILGNSIANNPEHQQFIANLQAQGAGIPAELASAILNNKSAVSDSAKVLRDTMQSDFERLFAQGFTVSSPVTVNPTFQAAASAVPSWDAVKKTTGIPQHADGGIFTQEHIGVVAEAGTESVIPHDGSANAKGLWIQTGQMMGLIGAGSNKGDGSFETLYSEMPEDSGDSNVQITYNPVFQFNGEAPSKTDLQEATDEAQEKFNRMMDNYIRQNKRLGFA